MWLPFGGRRRKNGLRLRRRCVRLAQPGEMWTQRKEFFENDRANFSPMMGLCQARKTYGTRHHPPNQHRRRNAGVVSRLRHERHRGAGAARCARRAQAGAPAHPLRDARPGPGPATSRTRSRRVSSARCWASTTRTATRPSTRRWCAWRRISACATRWWTARATSARSTATTPRPCATPRRGWPRSPPRCWRTSRRIRSSGPTTSTARSRSRPSCPPRCPTCSSTAPAASPSAWRPTSRPTTWARCATRSCYLIDRYDRASTM